jgi:hypothetical protein
MEDPSIYRGGLNIADLVAVAASANWSSGSHVREQRAYAYTALVQDCERVVDEVGGAEVTLRGLHGWLW